MGKAFEVEVTVPEGMAAGDVFTIEVEAPKREKGPRGQLAGLTLEEMTIDQLKREKINASSVLYKAKQRGAAEEIISKNQERVDAVVAELASRGVTPKASAPADEDSSAEAVETSDEVAADI